MAQDQRDYFIERMRRAAGYRERAAFRVPLEGRATDPDADVSLPAALMEPPPPPGAELHWSLKVLVLLAAFILMMAVRRLLR